MADIFNPDLYLEKLESELFGNEEVKTETCSKEFIIDCLEFAVNFDDEDDVVTEGFNTDLNKQYKADIKEIRQILRSVKKSTKEDLDYKKAIESLDKLDKKLDSMISKTKAVQGTTSDTVFGILYRGFIGSVKMLVAGLITLPIGGVGAIVVAIEHDITNIIGIFKRIMDRVRNKEDIDVDDFNTFKNAIIVCYSDYKKKIAKMKAELQKKIDEENQVKESAARDKANDIFKHEKLKLYEACSAGEITEDQREDLLARFKDINKVEESVIANDIDDRYSGRDAFEVVKKDIYERCSKGEFDIDKREDLIKEAYKYFIEGDDLSKITDSIKKNAANDQDSKKLLNDIEASTKVSE